MKIKKVAQTPGVLATVSTTKIDSDKDTYSCNYLNDNAVVVSPTEPSDGKVWIQRSGNLFDKNNANIFGGYFYKDSNAIVSSSVSKCLYIPITGGKTYKVNKISSTRFNVGTTSTVPTTNVTLLDNANNILSTSNIQTNNTKIILKTNNNANYLVVWYYTSNSDTLTEEEILNSIRIEEHPKKIHTKTDNGYEEFYNEENIEIYDNYEQRIGTWLGKPLYRIVFEFSGISGSDMSLDTGLSGVTVTDIRGFLKSSDGSGSFPIPFILGEEYLYVSTISRGSQIRVRTNSTWSGFTLCVTLEYTK